MSPATLVLDRPLPRVRVQAAACACAVVGAVAVPQLFHAAGTLLSLGTGLGETFLPMHLPILIVGLLAGPWAGLVAGALGPLASFALSGMPVAAMLPFMVVELAVYGLVAGLLRGVRGPVLAKVLVAQLAGRLTRAAVLAVAGVVLAGSVPPAASVLAATMAGIPGLCLQWLLVPAAVLAADRLSRANGEGPVAGDAR